MENKRGEDPATESNLTPSILPAKALLSVQMLLKILG